MTATMSVHKPQQIGRKPEAGSAVSPSLKNRSLAPQPTTSPVEVDAAIGDGGSAWDRFEALTRRALHVQTDSRVNDRP